MWLVSRFEKWYIIAKSPCVCVCGVREREREGERRRTECVCDKDTKNVCARGITIE
jgi:hypothetical protein